MVGLGVDLDRLSNSTFSDFDYWWQEARQNILFGDFGAVRNKLGKGLLKVRSPSHAARFGLALVSLVMRKDVIASIRRMRQHR